MNSVFRPIHAVASTPYPRSPEVPVALSSIAQLLSGLDREQRAAVTHRSGPALVIAGPGTGKTEVITRRAAWLIAAKRARPRDILALTFTDNAAHEMQGRIDLLVPYGQADTAVHTFHSFGDRLLREYSFELGLPGDVRLLTRRELIVLLRDNLFDLGLERYRPLGDPTRYLSALLDLFGRAKDEDIAPAALSAHAQTLLERSNNAAEPLRSVLADHAEGRVEVATAFERYCRLLAAKGCIDHADQVALALDLLRRRPSVRQAVADRYRYLLVDELQDTNRAQLELVLSLAGSAANVMAVGDPQQGIYGFRGALSGNVGRFEGSLHGLRRIVLRRNYRSLRTILDAGSRLIGHNVSPNAASAPDGASTSVRQLARRRMRHAKPVRHLVFPTAEDEADGIASEIERRVADGERPGDFAILVRSNGETDAIMRSLLVRGIPAHNGARPGLLNMPAVRALLAFLRVVADPSTTVELYALASAEPYSLGGAELGQLLSTGRRRNRSLWDALAAAVAARDQALPPHTLARAALLVEHVRAGIELSAGHTSGTVLYDYLRRSGMLGRLARFGADEADLGGLHGVARFFELVRETSSLLTLDRVAFLVPHLDTAETIDQPGAGVEDRERVAVLTAHRAKGLEFRVVFLAGLVDGRFPVRSRPPVLSLPDELTADSAAGEDAALAEERRLFYVALTRARDELCLTSHVAGPGGRGRRRTSIFVAEALDLPAAEAVRVSDATAAQALVPPQPAQIQASTPTLRAPGEPLSLSFSQVDEYLACPERYRLRYEVGLPTPPHHALSFGAAMHQSVAAFHLVQGQGRTLTDDELLAEFARHWQPEGFLSREHEEARYVAGQEALRRFRAGQLASGASPPVAIERPFSFRLGRDQIRGRIDRLDGGVDGAVITDYKSSDVSDQKRADSKARQSLQLQVYAMAYEAETGTLPARMQLHFLDSGVVGSAHPDTERLDRARQKLVKAADGIRARSFEPAPNPIACGYCPYRSICAASAA